MEAPTNLRSAKFGKAKTDRQVNSEQKLLGQTISPEFVNTYNLYYTGSMYMGYDQDYITDIIYDTGSAWLVMETSDCADCVNKYIYDRDSDTFSNLPDSDMS